MEFYNNMNRKTPNGLGDWIEYNITEPLGIKKMLNFFGIKNCGCEQKKEFLNQEFPFNKKD